MNALDLIVGPIIALLVLFFAFLLKPYVTTIHTAKYYFPALTLKLFAVVGLGCLYQFYYGGGDTFTYFTHGARHIYNGFMDNPIIGLRLIFSDANYLDGVFNYASKIWVYRDEPSFMVVRIAGFISLFSVGTYLGTSMWFAAFSFTGLWAMFSAFSKLFTEKTTLLAIAILFIPSTIFWGSGILKDTITFGFLGWVATASIYLIHFRNKRWFWLFVIIISLVVIYLIKMYIVLCILPGVIVWFYLAKINEVKNKMLKILIAPFMVVLCLLLGYKAIDTISASNDKYALNNISETVKVTAYDIGRWTGRNAGSGYDLGDLDGTFLGMLKLAPQALVVALFRPFLWEVSSPLMLVAALESLLILILSLITIIKVVKSPLNWQYHPVVIFCFVFAITFAFAVGITSYNFGTLFRYKIPLMPFYGIALALTWSSKKSTSKQLS